MTVQECRISLSFTIKSRNFGCFLLGPGVWLHVA
jgi:hypothetical protein